MIREVKGNEDIMSLHSTAFFCSRQIPARAVLRCYDWAIAQRDNGHCIIGGFQSTIERDVLHFLLKGTQPVLIVLAKGFSEDMDPMLMKPFSDGRILFITPFDREVTRITKETSFIRNQLIVDLAQDITIGYLAPGGNLDRLLKTCNKSIYHLLE